jgi:hypothetical protein
MNCNTLPKSKGYNAINVIVNRKTKQAHFIKTHTEPSSEGQAKIFRNKVFKLHRLPRKMISNKGLQYVSKFIIDLYSLLEIKIKGNPSTALHQQTNREN